MPLPIAHGLLGASIVALIHPKPTSRYFIPLFIGGVLANVADLDFLLVFALHSRAWHRGFTHSILIAFLVCLLFVLSFGRQRMREAVAFGLAYASHGVLDYLTTKEGGGVELLWPFSTGRLVFGWQGLSELASKLPAVEILKALIMEFALFMPLLILVLVLRRRLSKNEEFTGGAT